MAKEAARMKWHRLGGSVGIVIVLGACEVRVGSGPSNMPDPPPAEQAAAAAPAAAPKPPPPPAAPAVAPATTAAAGLAAQPAQSHTALPAVAGVPVFVRFPARVIHPAPVANISSGALDIGALRMRLRPNRKCGPREATPNHWIHIDCNAYTALTAAHKFSPRKLKIMLRGGLKLDRAIGPRHVEGDGYPLSSRNAKDGDADLPDAVDHREEGTEGPIKDQGDVGCCTAFSLSSAMDNAIRRQNKSDTTSSLHIWSHYGYPNMQNAGDGNTSKAIVDWATWPYDARTACEMDTSGDNDCGPYKPPATQGSASGDPALRAKIKDADAKGHWKVSEYDEIPADADTIAQMLATGADVWLSIRVGESWFHPNAAFEIADWTENDGGHATLLAGYKHKNGQRWFLVHNSWGTDWGDKGYAWISEASLAKNIKHAYKVVVADTTAPPPPPSDPSALTDDDCGEDQLVDAVTGQCAGICPDDSRPSNGQCSSAASSKKPPRRP